MRRICGLQLARGGWDPEKTQIIAHTAVPSDGVAGRVVTIAGDAAAFARAIYAGICAAATRPGRNGFLWRRCLKPMNGRQLPTV